MSGIGCPDCGRTTVEDEPCVWCSSADLARNPTVPKAPRLAADKPLSAPETPENPETTNPPRPLPEGLLAARRALDEATRRKAER